jgi:hypothetical protein
LLLAACRADIGARVDPVLKAAAELEKADATTMTEAAAAVQEAHALEGKDAADDAELARAGAYEELISAHEARFTGKATLKAQKKKWSRFRMPSFDFTEGPRKAAARLQEQAEKVAREQQQKAAKREQRGKYTARVQEQQQKAIAEQAQKRAATQTQWDTKMRALRNSCKVGRLACSKTCGTGQQQR